MNTPGILQIGLYLLILTALAVPLGRYMARVFEGRAEFAQKILGPVERLLYRLFGVKTGEAGEMNWKQYAIAVLLFNMFGMLLLYVIQRTQAYLPLNPTSADNPAGMANIGSHSSFNTAASFTTNTNWQSYTPETTMSYLTQMIGLTVHNFVSAAMGLAVLAAFIRGMVRRETTLLGNFWVDLTRSTLYILMPLSFVLALVMVQQGVPQTLKPYADVPMLQTGMTYDNPLVDKDGNKELDENGQQKIDKGVKLDSQSIALGPVASQEAIKELGTNGGGFFNANSAHPYENPTPFTNALEMIGLLAISAGLCFTFGEMVRDSRQGWAIYAAMTFLFVCMLSLCLWSEQTGNPKLTKAGADQTASATQAGGNMEGKETRFGIANSVFFATATTGTSCGAVNSMHDSYTPLGGMVPLLNIQYSEIIYGGVGCGLYGMLIYVLVTVFVAGLMVGRTPEYLGKKIETYEMKMASLILLIPGVLQLTGTAIGVSCIDGLAGRSNLGAHGFSEILYAFTSATNNNGSAFAGINANTMFFNVLLGICTLIGRFWLVVPVLAIAGSLAKKKIVPASAGTLPTHTPLFVAFLVAIIVIFTALLHFPALSLGPIVEHLQMAAN